MLGLIVLAVALERSTANSDKASLLQSQEHAAGRRTGTAAQDAAKAVAKAGAKGKAKDGPSLDLSNIGNDPPGDDGPMYSGPCFQQLADETTNSDYQNCQDILDTNKAEAKEIMKDEKAILSDNDAEVRDVETDYDKEAGETDSNMNREYGLLRSDDNYEVGQFNTMKENIKTKINTIMNPAYNSYEHSQQVYHAAKRKIEEGKADHDKKVNKANDGFLGDVEKNQANARGKSAKAQEDYNGYTDMATQTAADLTTSVEGKMSDRAAEIEELRAEREAGNGEATGILSTINANLAELTTTIQDDQVNHAQRADELINGNGDGGGIYNHSGTDVFTGENPPGTYTPSLATVMLAGETLADKFEDGMEEGITTFADSQEEEADAMEAHLKEENELVEAAHEETMEGTEESIDKFSEDMEKRIDEYDAEVVKRGDESLAKEHETREAVEAVVEYLESTVHAIEGQAKRLAPTSDKLLQEAVHKLSVAAGLSKDDVAKHGEDLGAGIFAALKEQITSIDAAEKELAANGTSSIKQIADHADAFNKFTMGQGGNLNCTENPEVCKTTVKEIAGQLKLDQDQQNKDAEDINVLQSMVKKATEYPTEAKDLASQVSNEQSEVGEALNSFTSTMNQDIPATEAKNSKLVSGFEGVARNGVVKTREALTAEINEMIEMTLASTEKMSSESFDDSSALKGEVSKENTAAYEAMTTFMRNLETMAELRKTSGEDTKKYVDMAREVNEQANTLMTTLSEPLQEALIGARAENQGAMSTEQEDLAAMINKQQALADVEIEKVLKKVTSAGKLEWKERDERAKQQRAMTTVIDERSGHGKALASHADAVFGEISSVVDKSVSTLNAVLAAVKEQLRTQADSADAQVAADAQAMAREADQLISKYHGELDGIIANYNGAVTDASAQLDAELAADSGAEQTQAAVAGRALSDEAQAVAELQTAADGKVGDAAVNTVDDANAVVEAAATAAQDAETAATDEENKVSQKINQEQLDAADQGEDVIKNSTDTVDAALKADEAKVDAAEDEADAQLGNATAENDAAHAQDDAEIEGGADQADKSAGTIDQEGEDAEHAIESTEKKEEEQVKSEEEALDGEGKEATEEKAKEKADAAETAKTIDDADKIVEGEVDAVKDEETNRMKALDPSARLRTVQANLAHVQTTIQEQTKLVSKEVGKAILSSEELNKKVTAGLPEFKRTLSKLSPSVDTLQKNVPVVMNALRQKMDSVFTELESKMRDITANSDGVKDRVDQKLGMLKKKFQKTEGKIVDMLDMATYQSADAMNRVKDNVEDGLKIDQELNTEVEDVVQPKTNEYRGKMDAVFKMLGMDVDHEAIMKRANQTMENEMALRERLAGSGADLEAAVRALNKATKQQLDAAFLHMTQQIAGVMADQRLSAAQKESLIRQLKEMGRQQQNAIAGGMGNLVNAQFHEMHSLDEKSMTAEALLTRSQQLAAGEGTSLTPQQMQAMQKEAADKMQDLRRYISSANGDAAQESLLQTSSSSSDLNLRTAADDEADTRHFVEEEAALRHLHKKTEHKAEDWLKSLQVINGV